MTLALIIVSIICCILGLFCESGRLQLCYFTFMIIAIVGAGASHDHDKKVQQALLPPIRDTLKLRDYQLDITSDESYIYDGTRLVGKFQLGNNTLEQLIEIDNK